MSKVCIPKELDERSIFFRVNLLVYFTTTGEPEKLVARSFGQRGQRKKTFSKRVGLHIAITLVIRGSVIHGDTNS